MDKIDELINYSEEELQREVKRRNEEAHLEVIRRLSTVLGEDVSNNCKRAEGQEIEWNGLLFGKINHVDSYWYRYTHPERPLNIKNALYVRPLRGGHSGEIFSDKVGLGLALKQTKDKVKPPKEPQLPPNTYISDTEVSLVKKFFDLIFNR